MRENVAFYSEGSAVKGHLYLPDEAGAPLPAVVLCHGFAGVKEMLLPAFAEAFARKGYAVLAFDYRGFGESEGVSGRLVPEEQVADIRNAVTYMTSRSNIDPSRIGLWGSSYGGANVVAAAARDSRIRSLVVQLTFGDGERVIMSGKSEEEQAKIRETVQKIWMKEVTTGKGMMLGVNRFLTDEQSQAFYRENVEKYPALKVKIPFLTMKETMEFKPERLVKDVRAPILIIAAGNDRVNPPDESLKLYEAGNDPKSLSIIPGASHYAVYEGALFEQAFSKALDWFNRYLL